jgi:hypothetical protein
MEKQVTTKDRWIQVAIFAFVIVMGIVYAWAMHMAQVAHAF